MEVEVITDASILVPCEAHRNFRSTNEFIPKGTKLNGHPKIVKGLQRGKPFDYNLFYTDKDEIIYIKNIKPMQRTEVTLGADSATSATKIDLPNQSNLGKRPLIGAVIGAAAAYGFAKYRKVTTHKTMAIYVIIGCLVGFAAGKYIQSKRSVTVKPSK